MSNWTDQQLLREYIGSHSESAFTELVQRHIDVVYSVALRMVRNKHLAEDVTQAVFMALAQNSRQLANRPVFSAWLHRTTMNIAAQTVRTDVRRRVREHKAAALNPLLSTDSDVLWELVVPQLDNAIGELNDSDREVVLLRYFERKSAREMGNILGISDEAAQKRVNRAVDRLREALAKRGVAIGTTGLTLAISANAVQAAPVGLACTISFTAFASSSISGSASIALAKSIAMTTIQKSFTVAAAIVLVGATIYEASQISQLRGQVQALQQKQLPMANQMQQLQRERDEAVNHLKLLNWQMAKLETNPGELFKLRAEIGRLRAEKADFASESWQGQINSLKQKFDQMPEKKIPELQILTDKEWAGAAWDADLTSEDGIREALSKVRDEAETKLMGEMQAAMKRYLAAHNQNLPVTLSELQPYFSFPVTEEMLGRYQLLQTGKPDYNTALVRLTAPYADKDFDSTHQMSMNGASGSRFNLMNEAVRSAANAFTAENGELPINASQILPYLQRPVETATIEKYLGRFLAEHPSSDLVLLSPSLAAYAAAHNDQRPKEPSELLPYVTTPEQRSAIEMLMKTQKSSTR